MINEFIAHIKSNNFFTKKDKLLVATSGGVDSIVLCQLLTLTGYNFAIAHCNFQLRGDDSVKDEAFVQNFARELNVLYFTKKFDTKKHSESKKISTQVAARNLRYEWFNELTEKNKFDYILTAHHASDQTETVLYNLTKGTGISGLRGIPSKNKNIRRPLLFASKNEILKFASGQNLKWREDASNLDDKYSRNLIRNKVVPALKEINPSIGETMLRNIERFQSIEAFIKASTADISTKYLSQTNKGIVIQLIWLNSENKILLHHLLSEYSFNFIQIEDILASIAKSGKIFFSPSHQLIIDRNRLFINTRTEDKIFNTTVTEADFKINIPNYQFIISEHKKTDISINKNQHFAYLDADKITFPFLIRNWHQGDKFMPFGMKSEKKLSDFMIDEKIPVNLKKRLPIFETNNQIFWVAGHRIDDRFKIDSKTESVLIIKIDFQDV